MPEQASHLSGRKSAGNGSDCRSSGTSTFLLTQAFHSGAGKHCRTRNQLDPGPTPLSPTPRPKLEPRPPRALPAQEPASPPGPASRVLRPSPLHPLTQALTARLRTVSPKVRKLHRRAGRGPAGRGRDAELPEGSSSGSKSRPRTLGGTPCPAPSSPDPARFTGASEPPGPQFSLLPWRARARDVIAQGGHVPRCRRGRGASRKSRGSPLLFCQASGSWMVSPGLPSGRGWVWPRRR